MSSIGIIFREEHEIETLSHDWVPKPLGSRAEVLAVVQRCHPKTAQLSLSLRVEEPEESESPRTISVSGVWGEKELAVIKAVCEQLSARFYDAETGAFIKL